MWVIVLEMAVALALLILIVWWTASPRRSDGRDPPRKGD